tara:strand:+ start:45157 stop:48114 length:2958 start_codon:yes stop_codon:yes gene_type:complete
MQTSLPETATYILKNSPYFRFSQLSEDKFAQRAKASIITSTGRNGAFLTKSPKDFFLPRTANTLAPGAQLAEPTASISWGIKKKKFGHGRPVIILEEDYPGVPIQVVAELFEGNARVMHRLESRRSREGPNLSELQKYPVSLLTVVNEGLGDEKTLMRIERLNELHNTYRKRVLSYLERILEEKDRAGFNVTKGRLKSALSSETTGFNIEGITVIELTASRNIRRPEVAIAQDFELRLNEKGVQTMLCGAGLRKMLLFILNESPEAVAADVGFESIGTKVLEGSGKTDKVEASYPTSSSLSPLSLDIPRPPSKTSSNKKGFFSHNLTGMGYAIVPIHNDEYDPAYDGHPLVAAYNIGVHAPIVFSFLRGAGLIKESKIPKEERIMEVNNDKLGEAERKHRREKTEEIEILPDDPEITFAVPYGRSVVVNANSGSSTMAGFKDGSVRAGIIQLAQIDAMMDEGKEEVIFGTLASKPTIDPNLPAKLLSFESSDWENVTLHIEGRINSKDAKKDLEELAHLIGENIMPVKHSSGEALSVFEDEVINGNAIELGVIVAGKTSYYKKRMKATATVLGFEAKGKRFENGEIGTVLLGVVSEGEIQKPVIDANTGEKIRTKKKKKTLFNSIGKVGAFRGISVQDRRALLSHLSEYATHQDGNMVFVDPLESDLILEVEFENMNLKMQPIYSRTTQLVDNLDRAKSAAEDRMRDETPPMKYKDPETGRMREMQVSPVMPVGQTAPPRGVPEKIRGLSRISIVDVKQLPDLVNPRVVGIRSVIEGLDFNVDEGETLTAKSEYETDKGKVFLSDISLDQFKINGPEPFIPNEFEPSVEALIAASLNPPTANFSSHRQIPPWKFKHTGDKSGKAILRTFNLDKKKDRDFVKNIIGWNERYDGYEGGLVIAGKLRDTVENWAVQTIRIPKKYGLRRTVNEIRLDSLQPVPWYLKAHPRTKLPDSKDIERAARPKFRAFVEEEDEKEALLAQRGSLD